ncbi:tRNA (uracil-O(2)-)-methyltransferase [Hypsizygus marmoreus]|uniref:tRNA (uracil-O(2)-)-methyltransferase n=1 Tax=Hypsizygus marmoreus TaxID=39966 RepID=A0A369J971_HYPMA|nr:tRNA (uracil-O(2)-)-methyltransferase [Hypsizygus marmoreus]
MSSTNPNTRPRFDPSPCDPRNLKCPTLVNDGSSWLPLIFCPAAFPSEIFEIAVSQLIHHPEYNSTLILRSDTVAEMTSEFPPSIPKLEGKHLTRVIHRKLLARRPGRDGSLEQYCSLYTSEAHGDSTHPAFPDTLLLTPIVHEGGSLPYYHPAVSHLAFRYIPSSPPTLRIEVVPLPGTPIDLNSRLYRTCLALLDTLDRYGWGALTNYKKRVHHDCLVPRETYQDLYLVMRERHKHLVDTWQEVTDPLKHVFEDIGIATYLMLLWKDTYTTPSSEDTQEADSEEPWKSWPRPPGGFLDFGCGNGLLTHILVQEGYDGFGIDLRARTSWSHYPESTQAHLHVYSFDPSSSFSMPTAPDLANPYFKPSLFLIGNHADELTPYLPVLSTIHSFSGYLSIPCCAWSFDAKYERTTTPLFPLPVAPSNSDPKAEMSWEAFSETLNLGGDGGKSSYSMYRVWLASLSVWCGWEVECEMLRIPSTRNWAIIGRRRSKTIDPEEAMENAMDILEGVFRRGIFKARKPEGKDNAH